MNEFVMSEEEKREYIQEVNEKYLKETPMSPKERRALKRWLREGHCAFEPCDSPYLPGPAYPPYDFLDCYRLNEIVERETAGMDDEAKTGYLRGMWGLNKKPETSEKPAKAIDDVHTKTRRLGKYLMLLRDYLMQEALWDEAKEYIAEHEDEEFWLEPEWLDF